MSLITWKYIKLLDDKNAVDKFLEKNNIKLPVEVIEFIKLNNGGRPSKNTFDTETSYERVFKALLSYNIEDKENIYAIYSNRFKDKGLFPIASDPAGNFICVDLKEDYKIVFYEHENLKKEFISPNILEFIDKLY